MRIQNITNIQSSQNTNNVYLTQKNKTVLSYSHSKNPLNYPFNFALGYDLISFGKMPFYQTLKDNYFCLPKDCFPDEFQTDAGKSLNKGESVIVEAPTGTGKTAIAHYIMTKNLKENKKTFYTTPLKALSNQKLKEFQNIYGTENVGILTGDKKENIKAPIIVMTTEVYRNMALKDNYEHKNPLMDNLGTVIFDELHYLGDLSRGSVWEEALMYTPKNVQTLGLSATIGNPDKLRDWISSLSDKKVKLVSVPSEARHVPLKFDGIYTKSYQKSEDRIQKQIIKTGTYNYDNSNDGFPPKPNLSDYKNVINKLEKEEKLPAILFIFSKNFSKELLDYLSKENKSLTNDKEKEQIKEILNKYSSKKYIGADLNETALINGYAIHNSSIIPAQKELIEELFQKKLLKTVIATETLSAGINMPAKTVVISSPYKPNDKIDSDEKQRLLTANEFKQMAGRAGRRGIDKEGFVYTLPTDRISEMDFLELETVDSVPIESHYDPDYSFLCGFYEFNSDREDLINIFDKSFYAFNDEELKKQENIQKLLQDSLIKTEILKEKNFLNENNGVYSLTDKGFMASKIKGYNSIAIVDMIKSGKLKDITPETLAFVFGAAANPANREEIEFNKDSDFSSLINNSKKHILNIKDSLENSVNYKLKSLGKSADSFYDYSQMSDYVKNLSKPDSKEDFVLLKLNELQEKQNKINIIQETKCEMSPNQLVTAFKQNETVPNKILKEYIEKVENYQKKKNIKNIDSYIQKLEHEIIECSKDKKGKKVKEKNDKRKKELETEINIAKTMNFLNSRLYEALNSNYKFLKKNSPDKIKSDLKEFQTQYIKLTSKNTLESDIKGLSEIESYLETENLKIIEELNKKQGSDCIKEMSGSALLLKEKEDNSDLKSKTFVPSKTAAQAAYYWTLLNGINSSTMSNWKELIKIIPADKTDEGTIYRSILQTVDLLNQIEEISDYAMKTSETINDYKYYAHLKSTVIKTRSLMINPPVEI